VLRGGCAWTFERSKLLRHGRHRCDGRDILHFIHASSLFRVRSRSTFGDTCKEKERKTERRQVLAGSGNGTRAAQEFPRARTINNPRLHASLAALSRAATPSSRTDERRGGSSCGCTPDYRRGGIVKMQFALSDTLATTRASIRAMRNGARIRASSAGVILFIYSYRYFGCFTVTPPFLTVLPPAPAFTLRRFYVARLFLGDVRARLL